jgi:oxygen-dependent protoporphyrinogen oxidase
MANSLVVGAGITGLSLAFELIARGERPVLLEPRRIGGMVHSAQVDGYTLECGPNVLVERPDLMQLLSALDLLNDVVFPSVEKYGQYVWYQDRPVKVPTGLREAVTTPLLSPGSKLLLPLRLLRPGVLRSHQDDESVESFFGRVLGKRGARALLDPVLKGIYGGDVEQLSARTLFPSVWAAAQAGSSVLGCMRARRSGPKPRVLVLRGGIQRLIERLWERVAPQVDYIQAAAVELVSDTAGEYRVTTSDGRTIHAQRCYLTGAGAGLAQLLTQLHPQAAAAVSAQRYASLGVVHLTVPRSQALIKDAFGVLFPGGMPDNFLGVMFNSQIFPHLAPADSHVLTAIVGGAQAGEGVSWEEQQLAAAVPKLLERYLGIQRARVLLVSQWPRAIPQLRVGHYRLVASLDACERENPGVFCVGVDRGGVGVSDRIRMARQASEDRKVPPS